MTVDPGAGERARKIAAIVALMPSFAAVFSDRRTLRDYSIHIPLSRPDPLSLLRQAVIAGIIADRARAIVPGSAIRLPRLHDGRGFACNIVDHQKLMSHPAQLSVPIVAHLDAILRGAADADIVGFSTAAVGLKEPFNRRSIVIGGQRIVLYPARRRNDVLYWAPVQAIDLRARAIESGVWSRLSSADRDCVACAGVMLADLDYGGCRGLSDQLTAANHALWPHLFAAPLRGTLPDLYQFDFEDVGGRYLLHLLDHAPDSFPVRMLVDPAFRAALLDALDGLVGAWHRERGIGSHFFWAHRDGRRRVALHVRGAALERLDTGETTPLEPSAIAARLRTRAWMPGQIVLFAALILHAGIKPIMGWSLEFITRLRTNFITLLRDHDPAEADRIAAIPLDTMTLFSVLKSDPTDPASADLHAFDVLQAGGLTYETLESAGRFGLARYHDRVLSDTLAYALNKYG